HKIGSDEAEIIVKVGERAAAAVTSGKSEMSRRYAIERRQDGAGTDASREIGGSECAGEVQSRKRIQTGACAADRRAIHVTALLAQQFDRLSLAECARTAQHVKRERKGAARDRCGKHAVHVHSRSERRVRAAR